MSKLILLGTGTNQLEKDRMASSVLIQLDGLIILYDMGRGITHRLTQLNIKQDELTHIIISHFHVDHFSDLIPYMQAGLYSKLDARTKPLNIYGPEGLTTTLTKLMELVEREMEILPPLIHLHEITEPTITINNHAFDYLPLPPFENHGLRFTHNDKTVAITGDSDFHQQEVDFLKDADIAIIDSGHISDDDIINLAAKTQAKQIICTHQYRDLNEDQLNQQAKDLGYNGTITVGTDLMELSL